jgi:endonuclease/exonuclease/phosphatase family metal-dependent hydrolase
MALGDSRWIATLNLWGATADVAARMDRAAVDLEALGCIALAAQEVVHPAGNLQRLAEGLQMELHFADTGEEGFGLGILARGGFREVAEYALPSPEGEARMLLSAHLAGEDLWVHSTHLSHGLDAGLWRERQVVALSEAIAGLGPGELHVLGGDFNAEPDSDEMRFLRGLTTLGGVRRYYQDAWLRARPGEEGLTWSTETGAARAARSVDVDRRLDYLYVSRREKSGRGSIRDCRLFGAGEPAASDHYGVAALVCC